MSNVVLVIVVTCTSGGSPNAFCSQIPFSVRSKNNPNPPRSTVFPLAYGVYAKPTRGPKFQLWFGFTVAPYGEQLTCAETAFACAHAGPLGKINPFAYVAGVYAWPATKLPSPSSAGAFCALYIPGSKFTSVFFASAGEGNRVQRTPRLTFSRCVTFQSSCTNASTFQNLRSGTISRLACEYWLALPSRKSPHVSKLNPGFPSDASSVFSICCAVKPARIV